MRIFIILVFIVLIGGTWWAVENPTSAERFKAKAVATASDWRGGLRDLADCDQPRRRRRSGWSRSLICR